ncbi:hypothetical protein Nmel_017477 [Mimus melanotis]
MISCQLKAKITSSYSAPPWALSSAALTE